MAAKANKEAASELEEIGEEILGLIDRADKLLRHADPAEHDRASHYWLAHLRMAISDDHGYMGRSFNTLKDSVNTLAGDKD